MNGKQLKNSILQWAIQGKLVPQDPNDEPASVLLEKIRAEKARLVKEGKLKKKDLEVKPIAEDEIPFEIPKGWEWCRLNDCLDVRDGTHDTPKYVSSGYPLVTSKNLRNGIIDFKGALLISKEDHEAISCRSRVDENDILFAMIGSIGNPVLVRHKETDFSIKNMALFKHVDDFVSMDYVYWFLCFAQVDMKEYASGGVQSFVSLGYLRNYLIPLPPLAEQHRIVAKIEELMPLVEKYGAAQDALEEWNNALPEKLKKSILQEAIQGRLVAQDPSDEPASALLERIREEKKRLVKEGKLKKKDLEVKPIEEDDVPFEIPKSWEWGRVNDLMELMNGYSFESNKYVDDGIRVIRITNVQDGYIVDKQPKYYPLNSIPEIADFMLREHDLLMSLTGNVGRVGFLQKELLPAALNQRVACLRFYSNLVLDIYIFYYFQSSHFITTCLESSKGMAQKNMSTEWLKKQLIPIPPLAEQRRIVAKIEELFGLLKK